MADKVQLTEREKQLITLMAEHSMRVSEVSDAMFMHRNTIIYNLEAFERRHGYDLRRFDDLVQLVGMVKAEGNHWIKTDKPLLQCSACGYYDNWGNFCRTCGAEMGGGIVDARTPATAD